MKNLDNMLKKGLTYKKDENINISYELSLKIDKYEENKDKRNNFIVNHVFSLIVLSLSLFSAFIFDYLISKMQLAIEFYFELFNLDFFTVKYFCLSFFIALSAFMAFFAVKNFIKDLRIYRAKNRLNSFMVI
jgi:hypothetical protein